MSEGPAVDLEDCQDCGACCFGGEPHVPLLGRDHAFLSVDELHTMTVWVGNLCFMKMVDSHCVALDLSAGRFTCSIYERRPSICREYERGGAECQADREKRGRPLPSVS